MIFFTVKYPFLIQIVGKHHISPTVPIKTYLNQANLIQYAHILSWSVIKIVLVGIHRSISLESTLSMLLTLDYGALQQTRVHLGFIIAFAQVFLHVVIFQTLIKVYIKIYFSSVRQDVFRNDQMDFSGRNGYIFKVVKCYFPIVCNGQL